MKKTVLKKAFLIAGLSALLLAVMGAALDLGIKRSLKLRKVYVASRRISPRTLINESDLTEMLLPKDYVYDFIYTDKNDILGHYTDIQGSIPAGSPFYKGMLFAAEELPDHPEGMLRDGQSAYTMEVDLARLGGTLTAGQRVDVFATFDLGEGNVLTGCLLQHVRIISIRDHKGLELEDEESTGIPYFVLLAVSQSDIPLLSKAEQTGQVRLFVSNETYDVLLEATRPSESAVIRYLEGTDRPSEEQPEE